MKKKKKRPPSRRPIRLPATIVRWIDERIMPGVLASYPEYCPDGEAIDSTENMISQFISEGYLSVARVGLGAYRLGFPVLDQPDLFIPPPDFPQGSPDREALLAYARRRGLDRMIPRFEVIERESTSSIGAESLAFLLALYTIGGKTGKASASDAALEIFLGWDQEGGAP